MIQALKDLFDHFALPAPDHADPAQAVQLAAAVLLVEVARADATTSAVEQQALVRALQRTFVLAPDALTRLVELAIGAPGRVVPTTVEYRCSDNRKPFTMVYYNDIDPQAAVMTWGNDQAIVFPQPAASGAKYGRVGIEYWEHQGEASVDFFGNKLSCKPAP